MTGFSKGVRERRMPLVEQIDRGNNHERTDAGVGNRLDREERFPAAGRENDTPPTVVIDPCLEGGLLVASRFDRDGR